MKWPFVRIWCMRISSRMQTLKHLLPGRICWNWQIIRRRTDSIRQSLPARACVLPRSFWYIWHSMILRLHLPRTAENTNVPGMTTKKSLRTRRRYSSSIRIWLTRELSTRTARTGAGKRQTRTLQQVS